jgi:hypothetical protein
MGREFHELGALHGEVGDKICQFASLTEPPYCVPISLSDNLSVSDRLSDRLQARLQSGEVTSQDIEQLKAVLKSIIEDLDTLIGAYLAVNPITV